MGDSSLQVAKLELAARSLDLTTALSRAASSSNFLLKGAWEIGQWLGREKLNQHELLDFMEKAKSLAYANKNGLEFFDQVICGTDTVPVGPLFLQQSGSLGRLMAGDPNLSWIVSTVAGLFQHHRDDQLVTSKLTELIMEAYRPQEDPDARLGLASEMRYSPERARLRAVARKIVSSVWYNVVNAGCDTIPLPQELLNLCPRGHYLAPEDFGQVVSTITNRCRSKAILRTDHLLLDVLQWLLLHYDGTIVVNVAGEIVYHVDLGTSRHRELEVRVSSRCSVHESDMDRCTGRNQWQILDHISGKFEDLLRAGDSAPQFNDVPSWPGTRQKLYDIPRPYHADSVMWNKTLQIAVKCSAQSVLRWLLAVPLSAQSDFEGPGFSARPGQRAGPHDTTVSLILKRIPAMVNMQWGSCSFVIDTSVTGGAVNETPSNMSTEQRLHILLEYFPVLADIQRKFKADCRCPGCSENGLNIAALQPGCLRRTAVEEALMLLAHGIADGFGVNDVSSVSETGPIVDAIAVLLVELVVERKVCWDTWFTVASCVYLGCPFEKLIEPSHLEGTSVAAIQFGNLATSAPWLDFTREIAVKGCFGLIGSKGRLGVVPNSDGQQMGFRAIEENFASIRTESTEDTISFCLRFRKEHSALDHDFRLCEDESAVESDVILYPEDDKVYRLLLRIKTKTHWRVVDPSDAFSAVIRMLPPAPSCEHHHCEHEVQPAIGLVMPLLTAKIYTMDELLGRWPDNTTRSYDYTPGASGHNDSAANSGTFYITNLLDTHLKKNVALALSVNTVAVLNYPELTCLPCMLYHARNSHRKQLRDVGHVPPADRHIINIRTHLAEQRSTLQLPSSVSRAEFTHPPVD
ncbi:hypothetical protein N656DRAFT_801545 [Canariomyces notabilis]|uniref:Uncharacterized protein n=1 Tax=Canariomyces notabilis TaxID=2074819 RepID=A0AAN6QII9_9PEZI|nr:hypothetical protein N656DRAFT_801545 [Canariomyces arenarius]